MLVMLPFSALGSSGFNNTIAEQSVLSTLLNEHQALRSSVADLSVKQKDFLLALGVPNSDIDNITNGEVADILKNSEILYPGYIESYYDEIQLYAELAESKRVMIERLQDAGLSQEEIDVFIDGGYNISDFTDEELQSTSFSNPPLILFAATPYHVFRGTAVYNLINEDPCNFHNESFPTSYYAGTTGGGLVTLPLNPTPGTTEYQVKVDLLQHHLGDVSSYVKKLYNVSSTAGISFNYNLFGEMTGTNAHEGIDVYRGSGYSIKSISSGTIVVRNNSTALSVLGVYYPTYDITIFYMHMNIASSVPAVGQQISKGATIGTEDNRGNGIGVHTHIQIQSGSLTSAASGQDSTLSSLKPYNYFYMLCN
jgi:murein DD-endopeptidase MepM/ murein hydrolase activator NlpD